MKLVSILHTVVWFGWFWLSLLVLLPFRWVAVLLRKMGKTVAHQRYVAACVRWWTTSVLVLAGVRVTVIGKENLPSANAVFVANHQGYFDIPVLLTSLNTAHPMVAKQELER